MNSNFQFNNNVNYYNHHVLSEKQHFIPVILQCTGFNAKNKDSGLEELLTESYSKCFYSVFYSGTFF